MARGDAAGGRGARSRDTRGRGKTCEEDLIDEERERERGTEGRKEEFSSFYPFLPRLRRKSGAASGSRCRFYSFVYADTRAIPSLPSPPPPHPLHVDGKRRPRFAARPYVSSTIFDSTNRLDRVIPWWPEAESLSLSLLFQLSRPPQLCAFSTATFPDASLRTLSLPFSPSLSRPCFHST